MSSKTFKLKLITIETDEMNEKDGINSDILREMSETKLRNEFYIDSYVDLSKTEKRQYICNFYNATIDPSKLEIIGTISKEELAKRGKIVEFEPAFTIEEKLEQTRKYLKYFEQHGITDLEIL